MGVSAVAPAGGFVDFSTGSVYLSGRNLEGCIMTGVSLIDRWRTVARAVVLLVLALIVLDLGDRSCYSLDVSQPNPTISTRESKQSDACAACCVPDCFCCSSVSPAITVALVEAPTSLADLPAPLERFLAEGFLPVQDHIPITAV